jgi:hypothetical protein
MNAAAWILLLLLLGGLLYLVAFRKSARARKRKSRYGSMSGSKTGKPPLRIYKFHAVELQICDNPCESGLAIAGKRLLKTEAPLLPLEGCPHKKCLCAYVQYDDRRCMQRRIESSPYGRTMGWQLREERRKLMRDRRGHNHNHNPV